nr:MAG TPA: hypothetical protein [Caudoviricetes sp.]
MLRYFISLNSMSNHTSGMLYKRNKAKQKNPLALYFQRVLLYNKKRPDSYQDVYQKLFQS